MSFLRKTGPKLAEAGLRSPAEEEDRLALLACPVCHQHLVRQVHELVCSACEQRYPVVQGIPVLLAGAS